MANIAVNVNLTGVKKKLGTQSFQKAKLAMVSQMALDMNKYVPKKSGRMRANVDIKPDRLTWNMIYARAQFYGTNGIVSFHNYTTPGTGPRWDSKASAANMQRWINTFKRGMSL
ncbi:minor capsid protein [Weissella confusa]|uniref:Capsid protein n=1 Tax=Weissella confusa TaxID=1583 RepID=A0AAJ2Z062_WEICO|nr:minor capsid protein [Weissella confusa]NBA12206.1 capsid protein [Weissella confusa]